MAITFQANYLVSQSVAVTLQQQSAAGVPGKWWNEAGASAGTWTTAEPSEVNKRIALTDPAGYGSYTGGVATTLSDYTGWALVYYWDTTLADPVVTDRINLISGSEGTTAMSPIVVSSARTWKLDQHGESVTARNRVTVGAGSSVTLAMDLTKALNGSQATPGETSLSAASSVTDTTGSPALTFTGLSLAQSRKAVHFTVESGLVAGNTHTIKVIVSTTDGQVITGYGRLVVV